MIFCFSACGNSRLVASRLSAILSEKSVAISINSPHEYDVTVHPRVIWAFPIYSWGLPEIVRDFMRRVALKGGDKCRHFMVATCGDDAGLADRMWRKAIVRRGWRPVAAHTVTMPNTYISLPGFDIDPPEVAEHKLAQAPDRVKAIAHAIKCQSPIDSVTRGRFAWIKTRILYPFFMSALTSAKRFRVEPKCIGCGACSRVCPMGNITLINSRPQWSDRCTMCLGCYHHCPVKAINYGNATLKKGQYVAPLPDSKTS